MSFDSGTITTSSTPAADLLSLIHARLVAHPAWTYVQPVWISSTTYYVYRCSGAYNELGQDFYIALHTSSATALSMRAFEGFNTGNDQITNPVPTAAGFSRATGAAGQVASASNPGVLSDGAGTLGTLTLETSTVATTWACGVTNNGVYIAVQGTTATQGLMTAHIHEQFEDISPFPLILLFIPATGSSVIGGFSRQPKRLSAAGDVNHFLEDNLTFQENSRRMGLAVGTINTSNDLFYDAPVGHRVAAMQRGAAATYGKIRGLYRDLVYFTTPVGVEVGDTVDVKDRTYAFMSFGTWFDTDAP